MALLDTRSHIDPWNWSAPRPRAAIRGIVTAMLARWQAAGTRKAMAELTSDQLKDVGQDEAPRPQLVVRAGLMTNLMSMR
jgi:hypothetical protein